MDKATILKFAKVLVAIFVLGLGSYFRVDLTNFLPKSETPLEIEVVAPTVGPDAGV